MLVALKWQQYDTGIADVNARASATRVLREARSVMGLLARSVVSMVPNQASLAANGTRRGMRKEAPGTIWTVRFTTGTRSGQIECWTG